MFSLQYIFSNTLYRKVPEMLPGPVNQGDDIAGIVHAVGSDVTEFKPGDRVAAFHEMVKPHGSYAEYALSWDHTTFHIPERTSFEEASTLPLAALTAVLGLYQRLELPQPWTPAKAELPLIVYGASSAVGSFAVQFAVKSNIHPIIAVAGNGKEWVEKLIDRSKGDTVVDYRNGPEALVEGLKEALGGRTVKHAFDAISEKGSYQAVCKVLSPQGSKITLVLPGKDYAAIPEGVEQTVTGVGGVHRDAKDFGYVYSKFFTKGLEEGWLRGHPQKIVPGGLNGIQGALEDLKAGKASAVKYIFRIADTPGVGK